VIYYVSRTGTKRNLDAMRSAGFRVLISRTGAWRSEGFRYCLDSGAWTDFQMGRPFDEDQYERMIAALGADADFVVLPDKVAAGRQSLEMSVRWMNRVRSINDLVLIPVQDGMEHDDLAPLMSQSVGIFLGGSDPWKLATMKPWGDFCRARGVHYHVARVNTLVRFGMAAGAFATSADGSSAARYAATVPLLKAGVDLARKYRDAVEATK